MRSTGSTAPSAVEVLSHREEGIRPRRGEPTQLHVGSGAFDWPGDACRRSSRSVQRDRRLADRKPSVRVYLDATGLSMGGVHRAEKEQEGISRLQSAGAIRLSQVSIANESDQVT
jgi:hypothetical protein